jgi:hypothetical protein
MSCRVIQVIESDLFTVGQGTDEDPYRRVKQYYTTDGKLICQIDEWLNKRLMEKKQQKPAVPPTT